MISLCQTELYLIVIYKNKGFSCIKLITNDEVMAGNQFSPCKHNRKTIGKVISISQIKAFQFLKEAEAQLGN